jgi:putative flippase GtrA
MRVSYVEGLPVKPVHIEFVKFAVVGGFGTVVNIIVLYCATELLGMYYMYSAVLSFLVAGAHNFILNKLWTFREKIGDQVAVKYFKFMVVSVAALGVNLVFLYIFTEFLKIWYIISQVLAIGTAMLINFAGNKIWTFRKETAVAADADGSETAR